MSELMYAICSIGGVDVVVEHICEDETNRAVDPPLPPVLMELAVVIEFEFVVIAAVDVKRDDELMIRMLFGDELVDDVKLPFALVSCSVEFPTISRVRLGTRPYLTAVIKEKKNIFL